MLDREKVIRKLQDALENAEEDGKIYAKIRRPVVFDVLELLKEQEKAGTWKQIDDDTNIWACSECDEPFILIDGTPIENKYYYCPQCGAKMGT